MNDSSQSRKDAADRMADVLSAKTITHIGFWNVRTMFDAGKLAQVCKEMKRYNLDILGISETRWTSSGRFTSSTGETILYSGREDNQHREGVAIILRKGLASKSLLEWKPINNRLIKIRLQGKQINTTIIQCYSPTNESDEETKDECYEQLKAEIERAPKHDMKIIMGDLNAKVGKDNSTYERTMGCEGSGEMNENGEKLLDFCEENAFVVGGTLFKHKEIHKLTWYSPNRRDKNQIDHFLINGMWRKSLMDVRVRRGADVGSDHQLVVAKVRVKLRKVEKQEIVNTKFNLEKLKDPQTKNTFKLQLRNRYQALADLENHTPPGTEEINPKWLRIKTAYLETAEECLGKKVKQRKDWMKEDTWKAIEQRRDTKKKVLDTKSPRLKERLDQQYQEENQKVKRMSRNDKRKYIEDLATEAEDAAENGNQGKVFKILKIITGKFRGSTTAPIKAKDGTLLTTEKEQENRWKEHFSETLNRPTPIVQADIEEAEEDLNIRTDTPDKEEIIAAIRTLKNGKAPGHDNLNAELFKADPNLAAETLLPLFIAIWEKKEIPEDWNKGTIIKIPKKGNLQDCNNWRGITLLSIPSKILAKVIIMRISEAVDKKLRNEQAGFRKGRGCTEQIFALRNIIEQCTEWQRELYINFVDFEKAFDSLHRESLWKILRFYGVPQDLVLIIKCFYNNFICSVGNTELYFKIGTGVRQGCVMSALLFNMAIDWTMRQTTNVPRGIRWTLFTTLEDLDFADDLALLSHTKEHMQEKTSRLSETAQKIGLRISRKKSEVMTLNVNNPTKIEIDGDELPTTEEFTYLGSTVRSDGGAGKDIRNRLCKARQAFRALNKIWNSQHIGTRTKIKLYKACVMSTLLYGSECWRMTESDLQKLSTFHTKSLRCILRIFWPNKISNKELLQRCRQEDMKEILLKRRWKWIGHTLRKEPDHIAKIALHWTPEGKRKRGRPRNTWRRTVESELKEWNETWGTISRKAQSREEWRSFVAALIASGQDRQ